MKILPKNFIPVFTERGTSVRIFSSTGPRTLVRLFLFTLVLTNPLSAQKSNTIILDENGIKNLQIQTAIAAETDFEETIFALGRIEEIPEKHGVLSSRIPGRVVRLEAREGDTVTAGQTLAHVESRRPGDPPPTIELKAPISGLIVKSHVGLGEPVEPEKELLDISDLSEVLAIARVPEHQAAKLSIGSKAHIRISALGETPVEGEMLRFGTTADRESGTIDAVFKIANPGLRMRANMRAEFSIVMSRRENVLSVPRAALQGEASGRFVYVKDFDLPNAFIKSPVQIGATNDRFVEIISGLFPEDEVVTRGAYSLSFAGASSVSLKEALDAAHGHEHNEDGSEKSGAKDEAKHDHEHGEEVHEEHEQSPLWKITSGVLLVALLASLGWKKHSGKEIP